MAMLGRLVVGLSLFSRTCMAAACGGNDAQIWSQKGSAAFSSDMETCGRQCALASTSCASDCVKGKEGYSDGCAACFGEVFGCTRDHCKLKCIAGQTAECKACVEAAGCAANFTACSGFTAPSARMPQLMDDFTGSDAPSVPVCYAGSAKELGMKETVSDLVNSPLGDQVPPGSDRRSENNHWPPPHRGNLHGFERLLPQTAQAFRREVLLRPGCGDCQGKGRWFLRADLPSKGELRQRDDCGVSVERPRGVRLPEF
ncbi:unnamed protein product [Durusdinium trenchii]|uniref:TNFR-Cys domain-containing protein n=1 Tax=Durusdinium trenchii TaxID=1381693 RepID=A0ABP0K6H4_9DINO